jgi:hypothetical protein
MAVLTLNTNGTGLQMSVPYGQLVSDSCVKKKVEVGTYIDTNSERITNVAATPAHTKRNPYTAPAGPPLCKYRQYLRYRWSRSVLTSGMLAKKAYGVCISPRQKYRHILKSQDHSHDNSFPSNQNCTTETKHGHQSKVALFQLVQIAMCVFTEIPPSKRDASPSVPDWHHPAPCG